jgi:hypothetical protein
MSRDQASSAPRRAKLPVELGFEKDVDFWLSLQFV